ncbi:hypothetical protein MKZ38_003565 [Zalerion maritima]|uniref:Uncharacterized protein n=1 Tax=Zalerion maritima TaxID=339359 RepID=A0AAD5WRQ9_9PEZI|nr:hypothetical protein MKZ38_003565 [Zalerion maritima]
MSTPSQTPRVRSIYRSILRELPPRPRGAPRSPLQNWIREQIASHHPSLSFPPAESANAAATTPSTSPPPSSSSSSSSPSSQPGKEQTSQGGRRRRRSRGSRGQGEEEERNPRSPAHAEQIIQYLRAQRTYVALLERYNPGTGMDEEERVRLSARRVGMDLPVEFGGRAK